jgi:hypothetical protein
MDGHSTTALVVSQIGKRVDRLDDKSITRRSADVRVGLNG